MLRPPLQYPHAESLELTAKHHKSKAHFNLRGVYGFVQFIFCEVPMQVSFFRLHPGTFMRK